MPASSQVYHPSTTRHFHPDNEWRCYIQIDLSTCTPETANAPPYTTWMPNPSAGTFCGMDETQDLLVTAKMEDSIVLTPDFFEHQIYLRTISTGEEHPLAHGCCLVPGGATFKITGSVTCNAPLLLNNEAAAVLGDRLAFYSTLEQRGQNNLTMYWLLHVWDWHQGAPADVVLSFRPRFEDVIWPLNRTYLHIELYNVEDLSKAPQLQASFVLSYAEECVFRFLSVFHSTSSCAPLAPTCEWWIWTNNPADRVIYVQADFPYSMLVIRARILFVDIPPTWFDATSEYGRAVPWSSWSS
ncbi:hypothetical protein DFH29DRAFT_1050175 [Suillus ampliporus]|nr:hypothetical protein DFH29DRAFT_1050175 [Suillus ampliporus]